MDIQKYKMLINIIQAGNLTKAADAVGYTQSALSHMINQLEKEWGIALLERSRTGSIMTSEGRQLLPFIREICNAELRLEEEINAIKKMDRGLIRIGAYASISTNVLPDIISNFIKEHPDVKIEIKEGSYSEIEQLLTEGALDIAFLYEPVSPRFQSIHIFDDKSVILMKKGHPLARYKTIPLSKLQDQPFIMFEPGIEDNFELFFETNNVQPKVLYRVKDDYTVIAMANAGLGLGMLNEFMLQNPLFPVDIRHTRPSTKRRISIAYRKAHPPSALALKFVDHILSAEIQKKVDSRK